MINNREWLEFPRSEKTVVFVFADLSENNDGVLWFSERLSKKRVEKINDRFYLVGAEIPVEDAEEFRDEIDVALAPALMREVPDEWEEILETSFYGIGEDENDPFYRYLVLGVYW